jgi:hypothetical protein
MAAAAGFLFVTVFFAFAAVLAAGFFTILAILVSP